MLKRCVPLLGLARLTSKGSARPKALTRITASFDVSLQYTDSSLCSQLKDVCVRVIHAGGREELYHHAVPASDLMEKYPGMCVAHPDVFRRPHESILRQDEELLVGCKYLIVPRTTVQKLMRRHQAKKMRASQASDNSKGGLGGKATAEVAENFSEDSIYTTKQFYDSRLGEVKSGTRKKEARRKPFVPPIPKARTCRSLTWEPSLTSVQELSP